MDNVIIYLQIYFKNGGIDMAFDSKVSFCPECFKDWYLFKPTDTPEKNPEYQNCEYCGAKLLHTKMTAEEKFLIKHISKDKDFFMAMLKLREDDIIEYQTKISAFRDKARRDGCYDSPKQSNQPKCPTCRSTNIRKIGTGERVASVVGFGIFSKKINKTWKCNNCGYTW